MLQLKVAKNIETAYKEVTEAQLEKWFQEFKHVVDEYGIHSEHIYNMDKTGSGFFNWQYWCILGFNISKWELKAYVICSAIEIKVYQAEPGYTEWITVLEYICGNGSAIGPLVIFKGESIQTSWIPSDSEMNSDWSPALNMKGWRCDAISEDWIRTVFEPATHTDAIRLLVVDGHGSHITAPFIRFGWGIVSFE